MGIAALSPIVLYYIAGPAYVSGQYALIVVMLVPTLFISQNLLIQAISSVRKTSFFLYSSLGSLVANVVFSFLLIPYFGLIGAALGFSSVYVVSFIILYRLAKKEDIVQYNISGTMKIWASSIFMFLIVYFALHFMVDKYGYSLFILLLLILVGALIYLVVSSRLRVFSQEEREFILSMFPDRLNSIKKVISFLVLGNQK